MPFAFSLSIISAAAEMRSEFWCAVLNGRSPASTSDSSLAESLTTAVSASVDEQTRTSQQPQPPPPPDETPQNLRPFISVASTSAVQGSVDRTTKAIELVGTLSARLQNFTAKITPRGESEMAHVNAKRLQRAEAASAATPPRPTDSQRIDASLPSTSQQEKLSECGIISPQHGSPDGAKVGPASSKIGPALLDSDRSVSTRSAALERARAAREQRIRRMSRQAAVAAQDSPCKGARDSPHRPLI